MLDLLLALGIGITSGIITGLIPGLHTNLVTSLLIVSYPALGLPPEPAIVFITSLALTHLMVDYIPSIILGAPDENSFLATLPGHELLLKGQGYTATLLARQGVVQGTLIALLISPLFLFLIPKIQTAIQATLPYLLLFILLLIIFRETHWHEALIIATLGGILGTLTFSLPVKEPLVPLLSGLFGLAGLITSLNTNPTLPSQIIAPLKEHIPFSIKGVAGCITPLCSFLPGIGSGHAATIIAEKVKPSGKEFIYITSYTGAMVLILSITTLSALNKTRSGLAAALEVLIPTFTTEVYLLIIATILITLALTYVLFPFIAQRMIKLITKVPYKAVTLATSLILIAITFTLTNPLGILVFITATLLGYCTIQSGIRRINLMAALIVPAIVYYLMN